MFVYQADTYCDSCGEAIRARLLASDWRHDRPRVDLDDERSYDSDDYPKGPFAEEATDSPDHCASGADCLEAVRLVDYGLSPDAEMFGAEAPVIGALLSDGLTDEGAAYLAELLADRPALHYSRGIGSGAVHEWRPTPYQVALHRYWREVFADELAHEGEAV